MAVRVHDRRPARGGDRALDARAANERLAEQAQRLHFVSRVPMVCECSAPGCQAVVLIALDDYRELRRTPGSFLTAPGHRVEGAEPESEQRGYLIQRRRRDDRSAEG